MRDSLLAVNILKVGLNHVQGAFDFSTSRKAVEILETLALFPRSFLIALAKTFRSNEFCAIKARTVYCKLFSPNDFEPGVVKEFLTQILDTSFLSYNHKSERYCVNLDDSVINLAMAEGVEVCPTLQAFL